VPDRKDKKEKQAISAGQKPIQSCKNSMKVSGWKWGDEIRMDNSVSILLSRRRGDPDADARQNVPKT